MLCWYYKYIRKYFIVILRHLLDVLLTLSSYQCIISHLRDNQPKTILIQTTLKLVSHRPGEHHQIHAVNPCATIRNEIQSADKHTHTGTQSEPRERLGAMEIFATAGAAPRFLRVQ